MGTGWEELRARSEVVDLGDAHFRTLAAEDHLRLLCLHLLRHGAWRALWLCDIGVALESIPASFDWGYLLNGSRRIVEASVSTLVLAHRVLGARLDGTPLAAGDRNLPRWLVPATLRAWGAGGHYMHTPPMALTPLRPSRILANLRVRWPNPIEVTFRRGGRFNDRPRLFLQAVDVAARTAGFASTAPGVLVRRLLRRWSRGGRARRESLGRIARRAV